MSAISLKPKFNEHILSPSQNPDIHEQVEEAFKGRDAAKLIENKRNIRSFPGLDDYLIKGSRGGLGIVTTPDTHLYRVRKAAKIGRLIEKYQLGDHVDVAKKYLYFDEGTDRWFVVSKKLPLSIINSSPYLS